MLRVEQVGADVTRALRLAVLRGHDPGYRAAPGDVPGAVHLAAFDDETTDGTGGTAVVGAAVVLPEPCPLWPDRPATRLRGMAVAPDRQGQGVGALVLAAAVALAGPSGLLWCNARSTARRFYETHGFVAVGAEFTTADTGVPHFLMYREPDRPATSS